MTRWLSPAIALGLAELIGEIRERLAAEPGKDYGGTVPRVGGAQEEGNHGEEES